MKRKKKLTAGKVMTTVLLLVFLSPAYVYAADVAIATKLNSLYTLVLNIVTAAGVIVLAWGIFEFASAYQNYDTSQQTASLKKIVSGLLMVGAPQIIALLQ